MAGTMGARIRAAREASGMLAADLAERVGLSASAYSLIENDKRNVKANEATRIARALGISVLSLLEDEASPSLAAAARSVTTMHAADSALLARVNQIQDLRLALPPDRRHRHASWENVPEVDGLNEVAAARALADWVRASIHDHEKGAGRFVGLAEELGVHFGIDVIVESYPGDVIGAALLNRSYPTIVVNSTQQRQRSLFTLAHELGHLLAGEDGGITVDGKVSSSSPEERRANMFAAEFLLHRDDVARIVKESTRQIAPALARMMDELDGSYLSCVYRLHNLGYINAAGRDALIDLRRARFIESVEDEGLKVVLQSRSDELSERCVLPTQLLGTLKRAYRDGLVSAAPIAGLVGMSIEDVILMLTPTEPAPEVPVVFGEFDPVDVVDDAFSTGFPG
ncbi:MULTISPECIES: helix-turn-helix domain-containing protein [Microbacterium]|uniref:HTH cro/C1-type domain-containing protein n=1 Tax=Microbacterium maritypicum TaxID=33918 RepID=A0A4Y4BEL8_MICMQ|nr:MULTISPECIES: XRE family transcriptional regulator [Microbacterium]MBG0718045.1 ImmA/IrrE family metallo-endopeptidase [Microbacterium paulum]GEC77093.1 hypothetical protein MLI01_32380 [Microbacterium liquefaciens]GGV64201.1 hypothetical protein GCM10010213_29480 [Microbacterium liquefaciens]